MDKKPNILDIRGQSMEFALSELEKQEKAIKNQGLWIINDYEPKECYRFFIEKNYHSQTFMVDKNELRIFVSSD